MIYINTYQYEQDREKYRQNIADLFRTTVMKEELDSREIELIEKIDHAKYMGNNTIENFMGNITSIEKLSKGLRTLLVIRWFIKHEKKDIIFDISNCGNNVFDYLVEEVGNTDVHFLLCNYSVSGHKQADIIINEKYKINRFSEIPSLGRKLYETKV